MSDATTTILAALTPPTPAVGVTFQYGQTIQAATKQAAATLANVQAQNTVMAVQAQDAQTSILPILDGLAAKLRALASLHGAA